MSWIRPYLLFTITVILGGCIGKTTPVLYYTLNTMGSPQASIAGQSDAPPLHLGIGPVKIPAYLNRPQIVTRSGPNTLVFNEFHRWAGSFRDEFAQRMRETLGKLLKTKSVAVFPWETAFKPHTQVVITVHRFDGKINDHVMLEGTWHLLERTQQRSSQTRPFRIDIPISKGGYEGFVHAQSLAVDKLCRVIAEVIATHDS